MEINIALGSLGLEIRSYSTQPKPWLFFGGRRCEGSTEDGGVELDILGSNGVI